jgi:hypothetical protein
MSSGIMHGMSPMPARSAGGLFRGRLTSRSDVKRAGRAGRSHNRQFMRGGRA